MKTWWASMLESIEADKELEMRENCSEKAAWDPLIGWGRRKESGGRRKESVGRSKGNP